MFLVALLHFCFRKKALKALSFWIFLSQKEPLEATFSETCALTSRKYVAEETKSNPKQNLINYCEAASSEACAHTPRKWFAEEDKTIRKWLERHKLLCLHSFVFAFRILRSEILKNLWWLLSMKSVRSPPENFWLNKVWELQNDQKIIDVFGCNPIFLF